MKRFLILALKVAVLAVLVTIIFYAVDWRDSYSLVSAEGETLMQVEGRIVGDWSGPVGSLSAAMAPVRRRSFDQTSQPMGRKPSSARAFQRILRISIHSALHWVRCVSSSS